MSFNHFISQRNESILKVQYQPLFPLAYDNLFGPYQPVTSLKESIQKDFEYLLLTSPGEWPMNPDLGIGVKKYLFENYGSPDLGQIQERMKNQLARYLPFPYIQLISANFEATTEEQDLGYSALVIKYIILDDLVRLMNVTSSAVKVLDITPSASGIRDFSSAAAFGRSVSKIPINSNVRTIE